MARRLRDALKFSRKTFFNPRGWIDFDFLKDQNRTIIDVLKNLFTADQPARQESFEEAVARLKLSEEDIQSTQKTYRLYAVLFVVLALLAFIYSIYLVVSYGSFTGFLVGIAVSVLLGGQAFRFDFWAFQMRRRKLGATFDEWKKSILGTKGNSA